MKAKTTETVVDIHEIRMATVTVHIVGTSPIIVHRMSTKARQELLMPAEKKNKAERAATLKHEPLTEFQESVYKTRDPDAPTLLHLPTGMVRRALSDVAVDIPGATKAAIDRLTSITTPTLHLFGIPELVTNVARLSDPGRTPDMRTRAIVPQWAVPNIKIRYVLDLLTDRKVLNLLSSAGMLIGMGDWRPQRKGGSFGQFRLAADDDPELKEIVKRGGRKAQQAAYDSPVCFDSETEELIEWYNQQLVIRERDKSAVPSLTTTRGKGRKNGEAYA